jgi:hypothetical protein
MATIPTALSDWYAAQKSKSAPGILTTPNVTPTVNVTGGGVLTPAQSSDPTKTSASTYNAATVATPTQWAVDPSQTVQGQLGSILSSGSPLMQQAETQGLLTANKRGLLNSSIAAGEAQNAMISAATPIANADAATNAKAALYNTDITNTTAATNAATTNKASEFNAQADNYNAQFNASNAYNKQQDLFKANVEATLAQINNEHSAENQQGAVFGTLSNDFSKAILQINTDTNMNQQSKDYSIKQLYQVYKAQLSMLSNIGNVPDVSALLQAM